MAKAIKVFNATDKVSWLQNDLTLVKDKNGVVDQTELHELLKQLYPNMTLPEANRIYLEMDYNRSGTITFDE